MLGLLVRLPFSPRWAGKGAILTLKVPGCEILLLQPLYAHRHLVQVRAHVLTALTSCFLLPHGELVASVSGASTQTEFTLSCQFLPPLGEVRSTITGHCCWYLLSVCPHY